MAKKIHKSQKTNDQLKKYFQLMRLDKGLKLTLHKMLLQIDKHKNEKHYT